MDAYISPRSTAFARYSQSSWQVGMAPNIPEAWNNLGTALKEAGKPLEAHEVLDAWLRKAIRGLSPANARAGLERYVQANEDEMDEGLTPVIKDVVDAIMRDLK